MDWFLHSNITFKLCVSFLCPPPSQGFGPSAVPEDYHVQDLEINCCFYYGTMLCAYIIWKGTRQTEAASLFRLILELICVCLTHFLIFVQKMIADIWPKLNICSNLMYVLTSLQWRFCTSLKLPSQIVIIEVGIKGLKLR